MMEELNNVKLDGKKNVHITGVVELDKLIAPELSLVLEKRENMESSGIRTVPHCCILKTDC